MSTRALGPWGAEGMLPGHGGGGQDCLLSREKNTRWHFPRPLTLLVGSMNQDPTPVTTTK